MAAQTHHRRKMSKFYAAQEGDIDVEDTEIGRVRIKLTRLMAKKMSGNPAFKRSVQQIQDLLNSGGSDTLAQKVKERIERNKPAAQSKPPESTGIRKVYTEKMQSWKSLHI